MTIFSCIDHEALVCISYMLCITKLYDLDTPYNAITFIFHANRVCENTKVYFVAELKMNYRQTATAMCSREYISQHMATP